MFLFVAESSNVLRWMIMQIFVRSFGCSTNSADGETIAGCLAEAGHRLVNAPSEASIIVYNTCAVKGPTENRMIEVLKRVPKSKKLIVAGCLPLINFERLRKEVRFDGVTGPTAGDSIVDIVERVANDERVIALRKASNAMPSLTLPHARLNPVIGIIPVSYGCLGSCAYCCVTKARGQLRSHKVEEVVERAIKDLKSGARELWITSQDSACYGKDNSSSLADLIGALCKIKGDFKIRVGMMTPNTTLSILRDLIEAFRDDHVFKFVHLPVQSGDDRILKRMRRSYSADDFRNIVEAFRTSVQQTTLSTDVICGFPDESDEAFDRTMKLITEIRPDIVNVSKFYARPGTSAMHMQEHFVPIEKIKQRSSALAEVAKKIALEKNEAWVGWTGNIIVDEAVKIPGSWIGRNAGYKPIVVKSSDKLLGKNLLAKVVRAFPTYLEGRIVI